MHVMSGLPLDGRIAGMFAGLADPRWQGAANADELSRILKQLSNDLAAGGIGIGVLAGYAPGVDPDEYLSVAGLASAAGVPTFAHSRDLVELTPSPSRRGRTEALRTQLAG